MKRILLILIVVSIFVLGVSNIFTNDNNIISNTLLSYSDNNADIKYMPSSNHINVSLEINDISIDKCNFSINNNDEIQINNNGGKCSYNFNELTANQEYTIKVKLIDNNNCVQEIEKKVKTLNNLSNYVKYLNNEKLSESNVYLHDNHLKTGANDESYRFSGSSDKVNNWVCFGETKEKCNIDNLYRIIGTFKNDNNNKYQVKLITADYASEEYLGKDGNRNNSMYEFSVNANYKGEREKIHTYYWINQSEIISYDWKNSLLNTTNLNKNYYDKLDDWKYMVFPAAWRIKGLDNQNGTAKDIYNNEIINDVGNNIYNDEIGLLYVSDYMYASFPSYWEKNASEYSSSKDENWLHLGANEWTITKNNNGSIFYVTEKGNIEQFDGNKFSYAIRPTFYIHDFVGFSEGTGSKNDPFIVLPNQEIPKHKITYIGFENTTGYPTEIMDGDNLNVTFNETIKKEDLYVTVGGVSNTNFTVSGAIFALNNIKNDVVITNFKFYVEASVKTINFPRTSSATDYDTILTTEKAFTITVKNNDGTNFNHIDGSYKFEVVSNNKFELQGTTTATLASGSLTNENKSLTLHIKDLTSTLNKFTLNVTLTSPITKTFSFDFTVTQDGAIQYVEDLVDMALAIRERPNPKNLTITNIQGERFKLTRDLDLNNNNSYENPNRIDYGDVNGNGTTATNLKEEITSDTGFLPIGELDHQFKGAFNGGNHKISGLNIHKALQKNIGFFGTTNGATIKDLTFVDGNVFNENQTAGMVIGKMYGGLLENITVSGKVQSTDKANQSEDTYTGGLVGYVTSNATIKNCTNNATVTTQFSGDATAYSGPAGGIAAWMAHSTIDSCKNYGTVTGQSYIGGIAGFSGMQLETGGDGGGTLKNCENYGTVKTYATSLTTGGKHVGGIAGYNKLNGTVENNYNRQSANVSGLQNVGGIVGNNAGVVRDNHNYSSSISGSSNVSRTVGSTSNTGSSTNNIDHAG